MMAVSKQHFNREAEASVIGAILIKPELIHETILTPESFYQDDLGLIFRKMLELKDKQQHIDAITLTHSMESEQLRYIDAPSVFPNLAEFAETADHFFAHERVIRENEFLRDAQQIYRDMSLQAMVYEKPNEYLNTLHEATEKLESKLIKENTTYSVSDLLEGYEDEILDRQKNGKVPGAPSISPGLDKKIGGCKKQDLIVIGARPSVGKTAFAIQVSRKASESTKIDAVLFISIEMKAKDILDRAISGHSRIEGRNIENGWLTDEEWTRYTMGSITLRQRNIFINDKSHQTVENIVREIKAFRKQYENILVIIDYLQEIQTERKLPNRREEITYITRTLKQAARDNDCPVICISSLKRSDKRPSMQDLKESGDIEFAADIIILLHREDHAEKTAENTSPVSMIEVIVDKNRKGWTGVHEMVYERNFNSFADTERMAS